MKTTKLYTFFNFKKYIIGNFLVVQWLGLCAFTAKGPDSVPGRGTKILQASQCGQEKKQEKRSYQPKLGNISEI